LDRTFSGLARDGVSLVRTFLLCDARSGIRFDERGMPLGLDEAVFPDIDALVAAARQYDIALMPVLLDFHLGMPARIANGVRLDGRPGSHAAALARLLPGPLVRELRMGRPRAACGRVRSGRPAHHSW